MSHLVRNPKDRFFHDAAHFLLQDMHYWGGAAPGTYKCECGLTEQGCQSKSTTCECDSGLYGTSDGGLLLHKDYLPVLELHFGDTGSLTDDKVGQHQVKELRCSGDSEFAIFTIT